MGYRLNEWREMEFVRYSVSGLHVLERSRRVSIGLWFVRVGLRLGAYFGNFNVVIDEPQVALARKSLDGQITITPPAPPQPQQEGQDNDRTE